MNNSNFTVVPGHTILPPAHQIVAAAPIINADWLIDKYNTECADETYHWIQFVVDNGIDLSPAFKPVRDHIRKTEKLSIERCRGMIKFAVKYGSCPHSDMEKVELVLARNNVKINFDRTCSGTINGKQIYDTEGMTTILSDYIDTYDIDITYNETTRAIDNYLGAIPSRLLADVAKTIAYDTDIDAAKHWQIVAKQFDQSKQSSEFTVAILKKFIWQVKRKINNIDVTHHMMPVIFGAQGTGKSVFIKEHFYTPFLGMVNETDFAQLAEVRNADQWTFPIHHFDEMAFASGADVETIKTRITSKTIAYRPMGSNRQKLTTNNATMLGLTNAYNLSSLIRDESGNRRFVPLYFSSVPGAERQADMDELDTVVLWQSVDERADDPSKPFWEELAELQKDHRHLGAYDQYLEDWKDDNVDGKKVSLNEMWIDFNDWYKASNIGKAFKAYNKKDFIRHIENFVANSIGSEWKIQKPQNVKTLVYTPTKMTSGDESNVVSINKPKAVNIHQPSTKLYQDIAERVKKIKKDAGDE